RRSWHAASFTTFAAGQREVQYLFTVGFAQNYLGVFAGANNSQCDFCGAAWGSDRSRNIGILAGGTVQIPQTLNVFLDSISKLGVQIGSKLADAVKKYIQSL